MNEDYNRAPVERTVIHAPVLFYLSGNPVAKGDALHIAPEYHWRAGAIATAEFLADGDCVMLRADNGAVPTVPISALSWTPHPDTVAMEQMVRAGITRPTYRDLRVWRSAIASVAHNTDLD